MARPKGNPHAQIRKLRKQIEELEAERDVLVEANSTLLDQGEALRRNFMEAQADKARALEVVAAVELNTQYAEFARNKVIRLFLTKQAEQVTAEFAETIQQTEAQAPAATPEPPVEVAGLDADAQWAADQAAAEEDDGFKWDEELDGDS
jgi:hypothetical protein